MKLSHALAFSAGLGLAAQTSGCYSMKMDTVENGKGGTLIVPGDVPYSGNKCNFDEPGFRVDTTTSLVMDNNFDAIRTLLKTSFPDIADPDKVVEKIAETCVHAQNLMNFPGMGDCESTCSNHRDAVKRGFVEWRVRKEVFRDVAEGCQKNVDVCTDVKNWARFAISNLVGSKTNEKAGAPDEDCGAQSDNLQMDDITGIWHKMIVDSLGLQKMSPEAKKARARNCGFLSVVAAKESLKTCPNKHFPEMDPEAEAEKLLKVLDRLDREKAETNGYVDFWKVARHSEVSRGFVGRMLPKEHRCLVNGEPNKKAK